jgi:signal transduction histidine kinase
MTDSSRFPPAQRSAHGQGPSPGRPTTLRPATLRPATLRPPTLRPATGRGTFVRAGKTEWILRKPALIGPAFAIAIALLLAARYPGPRVAFVGAVYAILLVSYVVDAARARASGFDDRAQLASWLIATVCHAAAIGATGGARSPLLPALLGVAVTSVNLFLRSRTTDLCFGVVIACAAAFAALPESILGPTVAPPFGGVLTAVAVVYTAGVARASSLALSDAYQKAGEARDRMREDILHAATARARSLESIGAKVAHELKNPLSAVKGLAQLLARGMGTSANASAGAGADAKMKERIHVITSEVTRMELILRDYLSFSRPLEDLSLEPVDLVALSDDVLAVLEARAEDGQITLERSGDEVTVIADPRRLKEALLNLAANALEATGPGGSVHIEIAAAEGAEGARGASITIRDTGRGMMPETLAKMGTPFFTTREGGTGLGVVLARSVIIQHGGEIHYASEVGHGTTVTVKLPDKPKEGDAAGPVSSLKRSE